MGHVYTAASFCCGTCKYWLGPREINVKFRQISVKDTSLKGVCSKKGCCNCGKTKEARNDCPSHEKCC